MSPMVVRNWRWTRDELAHALILLPDPFDGYGVEIYRAAYKVTQTVGHGPDLLAALLKRQFVRRSGRGVYTKTKVAA